MTGNVSAMLADKTRCVFFALFGLASAISVIPAHSQSLEPLEQSEDSEPEDPPVVAKPTKLYVKSSQMLPPPPDQPTIAYSQSVSMDPAVDAVVGKLGQLGQPAPAAKPQKPKRRAKISVIRGEESASSPFLAQAWGSLRSGDRLAALGAVDKALADDPASLDAMSLKAYVLAGMDRHDAAIEMLRCLLERNPQHAEALRGLAIELGQSTVPQALKELEGMASSDPSNALVLASLARQYDRKRDESRALTALDRAARLAPQNIAYRVELAGFYDRYGYPSEAVALYRQSYEAALARQEAGEPDSAITQDVLRVIRNRSDYLERSFLRARRGAPNASLTDTAIGREKEQE